jgi:hypothetical protein
MENLYTLVVEYKGGTYISQFKAATPQEALLRWANTRPSRGEVASHVRLAIRKQLDNGNGPVALEGCNNVWCQSGVFKRQLILIHVVCTCV